MPCSFQCKAPNQINKKIHRYIAFLFSILSEPDQPYDLVALSIMMATPITSALRRDQQLDILITFSNSSGPNEHDIRDKPT